MKLSIKTLNLTHKTGGDDVIVDNETPSNSAYKDIKNEALTAHTTSAHEQSFLVKLDVYSDYFNTKLKCWEPLLEPVTLQVTFERSAARGMGCVLRMETDLHLNFSDSLVPVLMELQRIFSSGEDVRTKKSSDSSVSTSTSVAVDRSFRTLGNRTHHTHQQSGAVAYSSRQHTTSLGNFGGSLSHNFNNNISHGRKSAFSVVNMLGQPIRYLHGVKRDKKNITFNYTNHNERGLLDFHPTITYLHNCEVVEVPFDSLRTGDTGDIQVVGKHHAISLQVCGYKWLTDESVGDEKQDKDNRVQADVFGVQFHTLSSLFDDTRYENLLRNNTLKNAVKMVSEVSTHPAGGKLLTLRSVFAVRNNTSHKLKLVLKTRNHQLSDITDDDDKDSVVIESGETYNVPLSLLLQGASGGSGPSIGYVWLKPADLGEIKNEVTSQDDKLHSIRYSQEPIDLDRIVTSTYNDFNKHCEENPNDDVIMESKALHRKFPISCGIRNFHKKHRKSSFIDFNESDDNYDQSAESIQEQDFEETKATFTYNIEVKRSILKKINTSADKQKNREGIFDSLFHFKDNYKDDIHHGPCTYDLTVHPPFIIENLLPMAGEFDLFDPISKLVVWSGFLLPGEAKAIHTVDQNKLMNLAINLYNCGTQFGVPVHCPVSNNNAFESLLSFVKDMSLSTLQTNTKTTTTLVDEFNQQIKVDIENNVGKGGERHIVISVPFWVVNTSQYAIRMAQEGIYSLPAGTVSTLMDGSKCQDRVRKSERWQKYLKDKPFNERIFLGKRSKFHHKSKENLENSEQRLLWGDIPFESLVEMAAIFNYEDDAD